MKSKTLACLLPALLAGCVGDGPTDPAAELAVFSLLGGLETGEHVLLRGEGAARFFLAGGQAGGEYLIVPFFASDDGQAQLQVEIGGTNLGGFAGSAAKQPLPADRLLPRGAAAPRAPGLDAFHLRLREWEGREAIRRARTGTWAEPRARELRSGVASALAVPQVGDVLPLRTMNPDQPDICSQPLQRQGEVVAVTEHAILVVDQANPLGGATAEQLEEIAQEFDDLVYPVNVEYFGAPADVDENQRVIIFITSVVNMLTPPNSDGVVLGFFSPGDLFPASEDSPVFGESPPEAVCDASNEAEIFYVLAPDPGGEINDNPRGTEEVVMGATGVIGHELQHLINLSRRIFVNNANSGEAVWLNEGLSHIAEELLFYEVSGLQPRLNLGAQELSATDQAWEALIRFQWDNLGRLWSYLENPDEESLLGIDELPTRGAAWAFLRYAADHEPGNDRDFFFDLVNSRLSGVQNLNQVLEEYNPLDLMQGWTTSVFTDDYAGLFLDEAGPGALLQQPSWDFRSIYTDLTSLNRYPLEVERMTSGQGIDLTLQGGGAAFIRARVDQAAQARIDATSGGLVPPDRLRVTVVRLQ